MNELLPRDRFIRALRHEPVDRVPLLYRMKHEAKTKLARVYGIEDAATGRKHNPEFGGAPTTQEWADDCGADGWGKDAVVAVRLARELVGQPREAWAGDSGGPAWTMRA